MKNDSVRLKRRTLESIYDSVFHKSLFSYFVLFPLGAFGWILTVVSVIGWEHTIPAIIVIVFIYFATLFVWLIIENRLRRYENKKISHENSTLRNDRARLGKQFAKHVRESPDYYSIDKWHEKIIVEGNGDTRIFRRVEIVPGRRGADLILHSLFVNGENSSRDVEIKAFRIIKNAQGIESKISLDVEMIWEEENKIASFILLREHHQYENKVTVQIETFWKGYSLSLIKRGQESHDITLHRSCNEVLMELLIARAGALKVGGVHATQRQESSCEEIGIKSEIEGSWHKITCTAKNLTPSNKVSLLIHGENT